MQTQKEKIEEFLKVKGIKDTLFLKDNWVKGGLSDLILEASSTLELVNNEELKKLISKLVRAIVFTRDYAEPNLNLPAIEGWEWFDACKLAQIVIPDDQWIKEFEKRCIFSEEKEKSFRQKVSEEQALLNHPHNLLNGKSNEKAD